MARTDDAGSGGAAVDLRANILSVEEQPPPELVVFAVQQQSRGASLPADRAETDRLPDHAERNPGPLSPEARSPFAHRPGSAAT
ncbi:hypothetical protein [Embleya sp. MST-111070]|uniref:hypothetical protein n=1 Tax=Embleya sp. MST-111070 TaxID=3398231 RepID=UPI003F7360D8